MSKPKGDGPRPKDKVRVSFVTEYADDGSILPMGKLVEDVSVEVLKRADDPTIGEIRGVTGTLDGKPKQAVKVGSFLSSNPSERFMWVIVQTGEMLADGNVSGLGDVIGAVPDSPASEAQQQPARRSVRVPNEPHGPSAETLKRIAEFLQLGDKVRAVLTAAGAGMDREQATRYVESMSEYQQFLSEHGEKRELRAFGHDRDKWLWYEVEPGHCITAATRADAEREWVNQYNRDRSYGTPVNDLLVDGYTVVSA